MKLISLDNLKKFLGIEEVTANDSLLTLIIEQVSQRIETYTHRNFKAEERTVYFDGGNKSYWVSAFPIEEGQTLTVSIDGVVQVKDTDYYVRADEGLIEFVSKVSSSKPKILSVVFTGGYTENANTLIIGVPDDLQMACIFQCAFYFRRRADIGLTSIGMPDGNISVLAPVQWLPEVKSILNSYRIFSL